MNGIEAREKIGNEYIKARLWTMPNSKAAWAHNGYKWFMHNIAYSLSPVFLLWVVVLPLPLTEEQMSEVYFASFISVVSLSLTAMISNSEFDWIHRKHKEWATDHINIVKIIVSLITAVAVTFAGISTIYDLGPFSRNNIIAAGYLLSLISFSVATWAWVTKIVADDIALNETFGSFVEELAKIGDEMAASAGAETSYQGISL